jgi:YidC/Oxa1 family membrane protein insertase
MDMHAPTASVVAPGEVVEKNYRLYVGPQSMRELQKENFDLHRAVDFGWYHAIANIFHEVLLWLQDLVGNMGIAIILLTILIKIMLWPLASKSYRSMAALKKLHPKVEALKKKHGENQRDKMAMEMMALYREHRVNPMSGCWPMLIQIPIFFALYKVVLISFEFRQAPFYGWIQDLSIADPFYVLPIMMGLTMVIQQRLSPPITDPVQQKVFKFMPILFTVMFLSFPAGLVLYWTVNSVLSIGQQWLITRRVEELG